MPTTMMRVRTDLHALLQQLAEDEQMSFEDVLSRALEGYRRSRMLERANAAYAAYAALRSDPVARQQELDERGAWDTMLMDGIEPEPDEAHRAPES